MSGGSQASVALDAGLPQVWGEGQRNKKVWWAKRGQRQGIQWRERGPVLCLRKDAQDREARRAHPGTAWARAPDGPEKSRPSSHPAAHPAFGPERACWHG